MQDYEKWSIVTLSIAEFSDECLVDLQTTLGIAHPEGRWILKLNLTETFWYIFIKNKDDYVWFTLKWYISRV